ncbi:MAG: preprotein translocase subunit SecG [Candidatus Latescibacteria bacterium]|jgi:preprotein translocase subunit SecG|nr:preprotein translocase subunit SecG [Candidatus Latescibacterota bacterium]
MEIFLLIVHVIVCFVLILSILMQPGKGGGLSGGAFGGGMSGGGSSMFGGGGAVPILTKVTTYAGVLFALTCVSLWYAGRSSDAVAQTAAERLLEQGGPVQTVPQPFNPVTPAVETQTPAPADSGKTN